MGSSGGYWNVERFERSRRPRTSFGNNAAWRVLRKTCFKFPRESKNVDLPNAICWSSFCLIYPHSF